MHVGVLDGVVGTIVVLCEHESTGAHEHTLGLAECCAGATQIALQQIVHECSVTTFGTAVTKCDCGDDVWPPKSQNVDVWPPKSRTINRLKPSNVVMAVGDDVHVHFALHALGVGLVDTAAHKLNICTTHEPSRSSADACPRATTSNDFPSHGRPFKHQWK